MNILVYTCNHIRNVIPKQILERFLKPTQQGMMRHNPFTPQDINGFIIDKIIFGRVVPDINITDGGATEEVIPLGGLPVEWVDKDKWIVHIPKKLTNGRSIVSALAIIWYGVENLGGQTGTLGATSIGMGMGLNGSNCSGNLNPIQAIGRSFQSMSATQTSNVRVVNEDTLLVEELFGPQRNAYARVMLSHDKELTTISPVAWRHFAQLCAYAVKAYLYNNFIIEVDMAELVGGQELGRFKEILDSYNDAEELYQTFFDEKWRKIQFMSDDKRHRRFLKGMMGRYK